MYWWVGLNSWVIQETTTIIPRPSKLLNVTHKLGLTYRKAYRLNGTLQWGTTQQNVLNSILKKCPKQAVQHNSRYQTWNSLIQYEIHDKKGVGKSLQFIDSMIQVSSKDDKIV